MLEPSTLSAMAQRQLAAWEALAGTWGVYEDENGHSLRCVRCQAQIRPLRDWVGVEYQYTPEQELARVVEHLRRSHMDMDPDR